MLHLENNSLIIKESSKEKERKNAKTDRKQKVNGRYKSNYINNNNL